MIFDGFHDEMGMMMDWNIDIWFFLVVGLIVFGLITILILGLMNKNSNQKVRSTYIDNYTSEEVVNNELMEDLTKFCPGCGEKIVDNKGKYCPICGTRIK